MKKYFLKDMSLDNIDDDRFRYQDFANNLRKIIECNESPFNIAIVGKWGLGKSSLINMALASLKKNEKEYLVCEINAWKYQKDEIGKAFLKELWEGISKKKVLSFNFFHKDYNDIVKKMFEDKEEPEKKKSGFRKFLVYCVIIILLSGVTFTIYCALSNNFYGIEFNKKAFWVSTFLRYCKNMGSILFIPLIVWLGKLFMDKLNAPSYRNYEISFPLETQADYEIYLKNQLQQYYKSNPNKKIIVVIDDLDRLSADKIVEALDALKIFMEYDRFIFIVPFDDEILKNVLKSKRIKGISDINDEYDGEMILDKIFQFKIYLPQLIKYDMRNYAFEICKRDCRDFIGEYCDNDYKLFEEIAGKILIHNGVSTPRQVKKIINTFVGNVMVSRDREQAKKVRDGFVTEKAGLETVAKISVLQSDYNEFYDLLFKDANAINEILLVHRSNGECKPTELLECYFDNANRLERKYEPLVNFLIFTEYLGHKNVTPYLYMAQSEAGVQVGDKKQQDFMAAIESCNLVTAKQLIREAPVLDVLLLEYVKYNESQRIGNIVLSAIDAYDIISESIREELAVALVERIPSLFNISDDFRYDLLNEENLVKLCQDVNSDEYNRLIECALNKSQLKTDDTKKVILVNKISKIKKVLSDSVLQEFQIFTNDWIISEESSIKDIMDYTENEGIEYIAVLHGKGYVEKTVDYIIENDDFDDELIRQLGNVIHSFLEENSIVEIIDKIEPCYDYPILYKMLDESIDKDKYEKIQNAKNIAEKIVSVEVKNLKGISGYNILSKIVYIVTEEECKAFDTFFVDAVMAKEFADMIEAFAKKNTLDMLPKTINLISSNSFEEEGYEKDIRRLLKLFTDEQQEEYWNNLGDLCKYSSSREYEIIGDLICELSKETVYDSEMLDIIEKNIINQPVTYYTKSVYLYFAIRIVSEYKNKLQQQAIDKYSSVILKAISTETNSVLNAYRNINKLNSEEVWCESISSILKYISEENYSVIYDIITGRLELFNESNDNLEQLENFLVNYINLSDDPNKVIEVLSSEFVSLGSVEELVDMLMDIEYDENNASQKLAKFFDTETIDVIIKIIVNKIEDDKNKEKLTKLLSQSEKYSKEKLVNAVNDSKESINKNDILSILLFCEQEFTENNVKSLIDIYEFLVEHYIEKDMYNNILLQISSLPDKVLSKNREKICLLLVDIFRKSASNENRRRSAVIIKDKKMGRKVKNIFDEKELKEYKAYLI